MYLHVHTCAYVYIHLYHISLYSYFFRALVVNIYQHTTVQNQTTEWTVTNAIRELNEAVEADSLGNGEAVMGFMKGMRTSGVWRQKNSREPFPRRPLALLVPEGRREVPF